MSPSIALLVIGMAAAVWFSWFGYKSSKSSKSSESPSNPELDPEYAEVESACRAFDEAYGATMDYDTVARHGSEEMIHLLFSARSDVLASVGSVRMRQVNDLDRERRFAAAAERCERIMDEKIDEARERLGTRVYPGPVNSSYAAKDLRAFGDVVN